jgi:tetratricopeptide (TPR) repeat protein
LRLEPAPVDIQKILAECPYVPDFILQSDSINLRMAYTGFEKLDIPTVFYGVDAPMNAFWQREYCLAFDLAFLDQIQAVNALKLAHPEFRDQIHWLPLAADHRFYTKIPQQKKYDLAFVGSLDPRLRPKRAWLLNTLKQHVNVAVFDGKQNRSLAPLEVVKIYNQSRIVINENLFPGLNLRTFEAMSCGTCLLTEQSDGSWQHFFRNWEHLVVFDSRNLVDHVKLLLHHEGLGDQIAAEGMKLVLKEHTVDQRSKALLRLVFKHLRQKRTVPRGSKTIHLGKAFLALAKRWPDQPVGSLAAAGNDLLLNEAVMGRETADLHFELAVQALLEKRHHHALASLHHALNLDPAHLRAVWALFWCLREIEDHKGAVIEIGRFCQFLRVKPPEYGFLDRVRQGQELTADDYCFLGEVLETCGWLYDTGVDRSKEHRCSWNAFDFYQRAITLQEIPGLNSTPLEGPFLHCAAILQRLGCAEFAIPFLEKAVSLKPCDAELRLDLAQLYLGNYRRQEGLEQIIQHLFFSITGDKWEKVEALNLSDREWQVLLNTVWDVSRNEGSDIFTPLVCGIVEQIRQKETLRQSLDSNPMLTAPEIVGMDS